HPFGGETPNTFITGFLSGLGHPVVGLDHLTFVIGSGLVAIGLQWGLIVPIAFLATALLGTSFHLMGFDMPLLEAAIA
ncbi:HupE/UreJ family protein, partial [Planococcus sp. SIMBA_160]